MDDPVDVDLGTVVSIHVARATKLLSAMDDVIAPGAMKALHVRGGTVFRILQGGLSGWATRWCERGPERGLALPP